MSEQVAEDLWDKIAAWLAEPFSPREIKFKPQSVKGNRALAVAYIDCRVVQDRLDKVLGVENWQDSYDILPSGSIMCRLAIRAPGGEWITKTDVGSESEQSDCGDRVKAGFSDALKRSAIKFGIGRYLYRLPLTWADYDPQKKVFTQLPQLPQWALPGFGAKAEYRQAAKPGGTGQVADGKPSSAPAAGQKAYDEFVRQIGAVKSDAEWSAVGGSIAAVVSGGGGGMSATQVQGLRDAMGAKWSEMHPPEPDDVLDGGGDDVLS